MQQAIRMRIEADSASGKMTETVRQSVNAALTQVEKELKQTGLEQRSQLQMRLIRLPARRKR